MIGLSVKEKVFVSRRATASFNAFPFAYDYLIKDGKGGLGVPVGGVGHPAAGLGENN